MPWGSQGLYIFFLSVTTGNTLHHILDYVLEQKQKQNFDHSNSFQEIGEIGQLFLLFVICAMSVVTCSIVMEWNELSSAVSNLHHHPDFLEINDDAQLWNIWKGLKYSCFKIDLPQLSLVQLEFHLEKTKR